MGRTGSIGVVVDSTLDLWFTQLLAGIEEELSKHDASLMLGSLDGRGHYDAHMVLSWIREKRVDGLITAKPEKRERPLLQKAVENQIPLAGVAPDDALALGFLRVAQQCGIRVPQSLSVVGFDNVPEGAPGCMREHGPAPD